jgi:hypothetical protein
MGTWLLISVLASATGAPAAALLVRPDPDVDGNRVIAVEKTLREIIARDPALRLQAAADTAIGVDQARDAGWKCDGGAQCLAQVGRALGVPIIVDVRLRPTGAQLQKFDVEFMTMLSNVDVDLSEANIELPLGRAWRALQKTGGELAIQVADDATQVAVDGEPVSARGGTVVVPGVAPGSHEVTAKLRDGQTARARVNVTSETRLGVALTAPAPVAVAKAESNPLGPVSLVGAAGGAGAAGVALLGVLASSLLVIVGAVAVNTLQREPDGRVSARAGQSRSDVEMQLRGGLALGGAGATLGLVALAGGLVSVAAALACTGGFVWSRIGGGP